MPRTVLRSGLDPMPRGRFPRGMSEAQILILGSSGFLGAQVVRHAGAPVLAASRGAGPASPADVEDCPWEASDHDGLVQLLDRPDLRAVILCAAMARGGDCESEPRAARALNVELPARVAAECAQRGLRLVHVSTDLVFGAEEPSAGGFRESDPTRPLGVYAETKREGELAALREHPAALVARLPLLFGDSLDRGVGASDALVAAVEAGRRPKLFTDEFRTPLDVVEAAAALVELARGTSSGVLHVAGPTRLSRYELGQLVLEAARMPLDAIEAARSSDLELDPPRPTDASLDASRARELLARSLSTPRDALLARPPQL